VAEDIPNPFQDSTNQNTSTTWLGDQKPVDVDLDGMGDYAQSMKRIHDNLMNELGYVDDLASRPMTAWAGPVLGEADYIRTRMRDNSTEFTEYLKRLRDALLNIGMAAQTIADTYASTDGTSATSINTVLFAFADPGASRPSGLPSFVTGETYADKMRELEAQQAGQAPAAGSPEWGNPERWESVEGSDGTVTQTATTADGHRMEIVTTGTGTGAVTTTTTVFAPNGTRLSASSQRTTTASYPYGTITTTTDTRDGQVTGTTTRSSYTGGPGMTETVTTSDAQGNETSRTTVSTETHSDGSQTITTRNAAGEVIDQVRVGAQTADGTGLDETPRQRALDSIPGMY
jgi:hypothetical protein